jgi:serine/threonine protein kinase
MESENPTEERRSRGMRYRSLFLLARGGMAQVHLSLAVLPNGFTRLVAVKSLREEFCGNAETQEMFLSEARLSARLNHPNVVQVSEVVEGPRGAILVMEYLDGLSFRSIYAAAQHAFSLPMRLRIICEVLAGLHYAHELTDYDGSSLGIVHRDVTPQNVFVTFDGSVKLIDFGIAKVTSSPDSTLVGVVKGKVQYMPLEQLMNGKLDRRADIYSVGCLLWEAVADSRIWQSQDRRQIMRAIIRGEVPTLRSRVAVDPQLESIVSRAMGREPNDRFATALEMRLAIEQYLTSFPAVTRHELGELLTTAGGESRTRRQQSIAEAIAKLDTEGEDGNSHLEATPHGIGTSITRSDAPSRPAPRRHLLAISLFALLAIAGTWSWATNAWKPSSPATSAAANERAERTLTIRAVPVDARVIVDDRPALGNPASVNVMPSSEHVLLVQAPGYESTERHVRVENDTSVMVELQPRAPSADDEPGTLPRPAPKRTASSRAKPASSASVPEPEKPSCDPPYYFLDGIKTYRPECI